MIFVWFVLMRYRGCCTVVFPSSLIIFKYFSFIIFVWSIITTCMTSRLNSLHHSFACNILTNYFIVFKTLSQRTFCLLLLFEHSLSLIKSQELLESLLIIFFCNHKNYNFLACGWFKNVLFSTNSFAKLLSDSLFLDSLLLDSLLSDSLISQSHSKM